MAADKIAGDSRCCSCRASWRRRTRSDEHEDKHELFPGAAGALAWFGRCRTWQRPLPTPACRQGRGQRRSRAPEMPWSRERASARFSDAVGARDGSRRVRQCGVSAQCARVQNVRSGRAQSTHGTCSTKCQRALELEGGAGTAQDGGRGSKALSGQGG